MFRFPTRLLALKHRLLLVVLLPVLVPALHSHATAQGLPAASKQLDISAFGGVINENPDFGPQRNYGFFLGANVTRYFHWVVAPSLEVRYHSTTGQYLNDRSFQVGPRVQVDVFRRFHPYADFLAGAGSIHFVRPFIPNYLNDSSAVYSFGGGVDVDLVRNFQLKFDYQSQSASYGEGFSLAPRPLGIGVVYRFPFRPHTQN